MIKVIKFHAPAWCRPCQSFAPVFEEIKEEFPEFEFSEVDIDEQPLTTSEYQVTTVPTVIVFKDGQEVDRISGIIPKPKLRKFLDLCLQV